MNKVFVVNNYDHLSEAETMHGVFSSFEKAKEYATQQMQYRIKNMFHYTDEHNEYVPLLENFSIIEVVVDSTNDNEQTILSLLEENRKLQYVWVNEIEEYM